MMTAREARAIQIAKTVPFSTNTVLLVLNAVDNDDAAADLLRACAPLGPLGHDVLNYVVGEAAKAKTRPLERLLTPADTPERNRCDICGAPATSMARDFIRSEWPSSVTTRPFGWWKYGCDAHPAESETHRTYGPLP